jgi:ubiquinone biosynthesis protein UbiJ
MLRRSVTQALNHLLRQQPWAAERLKPFAGRSVEFRLAPLPDLRLVITGDGLMEKAHATSDGPAAGTGTGGDAAVHPAADLTVTFKPSALPHFLRRDEEGLRALLREVELTGQADLAQVVQGLFRELKWDVEEDLSRVVGDVMAHRMAETGRSLFAWQKEAAMRVAQNFAEYWTEENPVIARKDDLVRFGADVAALRDKVDALEQRLSRLQRPAAR